MIGYFKCSKCGWQKSVESKNFNVPGCPECGTGLDVSIGGSAPDWYTGPAPEVGSVKFQCGLGDLILMAVSVLAAWQGSAWWLLVIPLVVAGWFIHPRWNRSDGFRFWR